MSSSLRAGTNVTIAWSMSYPHNGGWEIGIHRIVPQQNGSSDGMGEPLLCSQDFGCVDGTATGTEIYLPSDTSCDVCLVRLQRQALEVHDGQGMYRSCALVSIDGTVVDDCQGCSGHGTCVQVWLCHSSETAWLIFENVFRSDPGRNRGYKLRKELSVFCSLLAHTCIRLCGYFRGIASAIQVSRLATTMARIVRWRTSVRWIRIAVKGVCVKIQR